MSSYGKLTDGKLNLAPRKLPVDGSVVYNPPPELLEAEGYKPVTYTAQPEPQGVGRWNTTWTETEEAIVQGWEWHEATDEDEISPEEALDMLMGGDSG